MFFSGEIIRRVVRNDNRWQLDTVDMPLSQIKAIKEMRGIIFCFKERRLFRSKGLELVKCLGNNEIKIVRKTKFGIQEIDENYILLKEFPL